MMTPTEQYNHELYHYGVKGMKWGVRKFEQASADLDRKKSAYKKAKKAYNKSFNNAYYRNASFSPFKKFREASDKRWEDFSKKADRMDALKKEYKTAKKEFNQHTTVTQKVGRALTTKGGKAVTKAIGKIGSAALIDQIAFNGAGRKATGQIVKAIGRTAISAYVYANGGRDIRWYD